MNYLGSIINKTFNQKYSFVIKEQEEIQDYSSIWRLYKDFVKFPDKKELGRNALKRIKTLRHPSIIKFIDGVETDTQIIIATEQIQILSEKLKENNSNFIVWGLWKIANVLKFLNDQGIVHGNLRISSIFYVSSGEWKLNGLEYASLMNEDNSVFNIYKKNDLFLPPELFSRSGRQMTPQAIDGYGFGVLIYQIYNGNFSRTEDLVNRGKIPLNLYEQYKAFIHLNPRNRLDFNVFIDTAARKGGYFDNAIIWTSAFLEEINIKETREKEEFIRKISDSLNEFPIEFSKFKVLPELLKAVEFGGAGANALRSTLKLGAKLNHDEFNQLILPTIINLFSVQDNNIKSCLYENLESIISLIPDKIVNDRLFPCLASGFQDENPTIRELALKSVLHVAPKLNDRNMNTELFRHLSKLQIDPQPGIRTNTTICIGKVSKLFNVTTQKRVLSATFLRALSDPFPPARIAGLLAFSATSDYYEPVDVSSKILPVFATMLVDQEKSVREQAFKNMYMFLKILQKHSESMPEVKREVAPSQNEKEIKTQQNSEGSGWGDWALSTVSAKLAGAVLDQDPSPSAPAPPSNTARQALSHNSMSAATLNSTTKTNVSLNGSKANGTISNFSDFGESFNKNNSPSLNQFSSFNSAAKPLLLSKPKNAAESGWEDWTNDPSDHPQTINASQPSGLGPVLEPTRPKIPEISKQSTTSKKIEHSMSSWSAGNDDWGWGEQALAPVNGLLKSSITSKGDSNHPNLISTIDDDWNASPGDDWNSWAEPTASQRNKSNDWGSWSPNSNTSISIEKLKGENRKQKLQENRGKKY